MSIDQHDDHPDFRQWLEIDFAIKPAQMERDAHIRMRQELRGDGCPIQRFATSTSLPLDDGAKIPS